jgi:hypothetical protein
MRCQRDGSPVEMTELRPELGPSFADSLTIGA